MSLRAFVAGAAVLLLTTACQQPDDQETGSISREDVQQARANLAPDVADAIDSGNAAYRDQDYQGALEHYQRAAELDDELAAAWFGIYMAQLALGNTEAANDAMDRAQSLAPEANMIHPEDDTTP
jgi:tetratricopeptide (TPR) repeat protein